MKCLYLLANFCHLKCHSVSGKRFLIAPIISCKCSTTITTVVEVKGSLTCSEDWTDWFCGL